MTDQPRYFDCPQCGHIGLLIQLKEHPVRPSPMDIGFCPECGGEVDDIITEDQVRAVLADYGEDADAYLSRLSPPHEVNHG